MAALENKIAVTAAAHTQLPATILTGVCGELLPSPQALPGARGFSPFSPRDKGTLAAEQKGRGERSEGAEGGKLLNRLSMLTTRMAFNIQRIASVQCLRRRIRIQRELPSEALEFFHHLLPVLSRDARLHSSCVGLLVLAGISIFPKRHSD